MEIIALLITGVLLNHFYALVSTIFALLFRNIPISKFDSSSDPINTEDLLKEIRINKSFIVGYTFKGGQKKPEGIFFNWNKKYIGYIENYQVSNNFTTKIHSKIAIFGNIPIKVKCLNKNGEIALNGHNEEKKIIILNYF